MTTFLITFGAGMVCGLAVGAVGAWWYLTRGRDTEQVEIFHLRRHLADLRDVNTKLSMRCGHCGTGRAVPADQTAGGAR
jgi:hypothetical protein